LKVLLKVVIARNIVLLRFQVEFAFALLFTKRMKLREIFA